MLDNLKLLAGNCTNNHAQIRIESREGSEIAEITGFVRGPFCDFSRTLTADFPCRRVSHGNDVVCSAEAFITEPCYWTPHLPFMYEFHLDLVLRSGQTLKTIVQTGFKRWHQAGRNLMLQLKRVVFRGFHCSFPDEQTLQKARDQMTGLVVSSPDENTSKLACRLGVALMVDLRECPVSWQEVYSKLDWYPAVLFVLLNPGQITETSEQGHRSQQSLTLLDIPASSTDDEFSHLSYDGLAVQLSLGERPPAWVAQSEAPVLAISHVEDLCIEEARLHCDRLQAALAPHFDLAGYIV